MATSFVVTGSARGVGRAIAQRLSRRGFVVAVDRDRDALGWTRDQENVLGLTGDVTNEHDLAHAVERAAAAGPLEGWVNNAAVFRDAAVHDTSVHALMVLISANLAMAVAGSSTAIRQFLATQTAGAIVNVSSHRAQRPVPGALPYAGPRQPSRASPGPWPSTTPHGASGSTPSLLAQSSPIVTTLPSARHSRCCTPWAVPDGRRRSPPWSTTCCRPTPASSPAQ